MTTIMFQNTSICRKSLLEKFTEYIQLSNNFNLIFRPRYIYEWIVTSLTTFLKHYTR